MEFLVVDFACKNADIVECKGEQFRQKLLFMLLCILDFYDYYIQSINKILKYSYYIKQLGMNVYKIINFE